MKAFKLLDRPRYDGYPQARKFINSGRGVSFSSFGNEAARFRLGSGRVF
jgi:hypothetical protein